MRVVCLLISHLRAKSEIRRDAHLKDRPAVIIDRTGSIPRVIDHTPRAFRVSAGMTLEQAISHYANCLILEADEPYYQEVFDDVLGSLVDVGHRVEGPELGTAYVRLDGLGALYGGEARLVYTLLGVVPHDLEPAVGVGDAKFPRLRGSPDGKGAGSDLGAFRSGSIPLPPLHRPASPVGRDQIGPAPSGPAHPWVMSPSCPMASWQTSSAWKDCKRGLSATASTSVP